MKILRVITTATATIREEWLLAVPDDVVDEDALDLIANDELGATTIRVDDEVVGDETDRSVERVELVAKDVV